MDISSEKINNIKSKELFKAFIYMLKTILLQEYDEATKTITVYGSFN